MWQRIWCVLTREVHKDEPELAVEASQKWILFILIHVESWTVGSLQRILKFPHEKEFSIQTCDSRHAFAARGRPTP